MGRRARRHRSAQRPAVLPGRPMTLACPVCRADNDARTCRRCRADLGLLWDLEEQREECLRQASLAWRQGDIDRMKRAVDDAGRLRHGPDLASRKALAHLVAGEFAAALNAWHRARQT